MLVAASLVYFWYEAWGLGLEIGSRRCKINGGVCLQSQSHIWLSLKAAIVFNIHTMLNISISENHWVSEKCHDRLKKGGDGGNSCLQLEAHASDHLWLFAFPNLEGASGIRGTSSL